MAGAQKKKTSKPSERTSQGTSQTELPQIEVNLLFGFPTLAPLADANFGTLSTDLMRLNRSLLPLASSSWWETYWKSFFSSLPQKQDTTSKDSKTK